MENLIFTLVANNTPEYTDWGGAKLSNPVTFMSLDLDV